MAPFYSEKGRPSIDPELLIRMLIVGYCCGIRSERRLGAARSGQGDHHTADDCYQTGRAELEREPPPACAALGRQDARH